MALFITAILVAACVVLFRSMLSHVGRVPPTFDESAQSTQDVTESPGR